MDDLRIPIRNGFHLSSVREGDKPALLQHLKTRDVYNTTLNIPHPYTETDADFWIHKRLQITKRQGVEVTFAIREANGGLIGGIGADGLEIVGNNPLGNNLSNSKGAEDNTFENHDTQISPLAFRAHRAEIGYWLARPFWGQGIMTDAVRAFVRYAFSELELLRLTAHVFENNVASSRVLEKNGFLLEGKLREHFFKDGNFLDARLYGLLKHDVR